MIARCIWAENRKLHGAAIWLAFLLVPLLSSTYGTFNFIQNQGILQMEWYDLWTQHTLFYAMMFFAPLVGVYASYLWRLEHLGHNWNLIMAAPVTPLAIFFGKFVTVFKMVVLTQSWVFVLYLAFGKLWAHLPGWPPVEIILWLLRGLLGAAAVVALQLLLSMLIRNFAVPVLIALAGGIAGMLISNKGYGLFWPYALMLMGMNSNKTEDGMAGGIWLYVLSSVVFLVLIFAAADFLLKKRDVNAG